MIVNYFLTFIGVFNGNSRWYLFWGGFGSCLSELAILAFLWRKINCHAKGCYRIGLHRVEGTPYITCGKHHPTHPGSTPATAEQIKQAHTDAQEAARAAGGIVPS
jgi:hypothetical protein